MSLTKAASRGTLYVQPLVLYLTAVAMAVIQNSALPDFCISLFGLVSAAAFFVPGLKYHLQRERAGRA